MCRIAGFWDFNYKGGYDIGDVIERMRDELAYGGPDDAGCYVDRHHSIALGHRRLSILDLSSLGHQPMNNKDKSLWITHNGEVYNFSQIREELEARGRRFKSRTDTEVILESYEQWGVSCLSKFQGMWSFAIWDAKEGKLILFRDRAGIKPLYWYYKDGLFIFASELKSFHKHPNFHKQLDRKALSLYLQFGYIAAPRTIFEHTYKLRPGCFLEIDNKGKVKETRYWNVNDYYQKGFELERNGYWNNGNEDRITEELEQLLIKSFRLRMVSDVPVGIFLSGGFDSTTVAALLQRQCTERLKTFTIGFHRNKYDEASSAREIAGYLGTDHTELYCTPKDAFEIIPKLSDIYDEPFGDSSAIPTHLVSLLAKQQVKVALSADGGDETFCGYTKYWRLQKINKLSSQPYMSVLARAFKSVSPDHLLRLYNLTKFALPKCSNFRDKVVKLQNTFTAKQLKEQFLFTQSFFMPEEIRDLQLPQTYEVEQFDAGDGYEPVNYMMLVDYITYMTDDILTKVDRATMKVALEARVPLLDNKIIEYVATLPLNYKYRNGTSKYILRKILYKYVPKKLLDRPKQGFAIPIDEWFRNELKELYLEYLNHDKIKSEGIFNPHRVRILLNDYLNDKGVNHHKLWFLFMFQRWKEKYL